MSGVLRGFRGPYGLVWVHCLDTEYHPSPSLSHVTVSLRLLDIPDLPTSCSDVSMIQTATFHQQFLSFFTFSQHTNFRNNFTAYLFAMANMNIFLSDPNSTENLLQFLESIEVSFVALLGISEVGKCLQFYNLCRLGSDAKEWYETLQECNSDTNIINDNGHSHAIHSNSIFSTKPTYLKNTVGMIITKPATTTIPTPTMTTIHDTATATISMTNTAASAIHEITTTSQPLNQMADAQHITATNPMPI